MQAESFWQFSIEFYGIRPVKQDCLSLQDDHGLNVNLILCCAYADYCNITLSVEQILALRESLNELDEVTQQHRHMRRSLSKDASEYADALRRELELEKRQQQRLIEAANNMALSAGKKSLANLTTVVQPDMAKQRIRNIQEHRIQFEENHLQ
ncbi:TIGR02444 family protein [Aestuariibacter salexigens]|uniref:TIGR02444 family protein n=1 Tax=Aestuariibacter salexigens TaxID=226010 RepID=UPI00041C6472|nr:TIGR02444 family protein [Aestuariibacter salexigens]